MSHADRMGEVEKHDIELGRSVFRKIGANSKDWSGLRNTSGNIKIPHHCTTIAINCKISLTNKYQIGFRSYWFFSGSLYKW